jgi:hypothetical protein
MEPIRAPKRRRGGEHSAGPMRRMTMRVLLVPAVVVALAGCGGDATDRRAPAAGARAPDGALSIEEALAYEGSEPVLVTGHVLAEGGGVRLCSGFAESHPPQCAGPSLVVEGLAVAKLPHARSAAGTTWTDEPVELLGRVIGITLVVSDTAL